MTTIDKIRHLRQDISDDKNDIEKLKGHSGTFHQICADYCSENGFDLTDRFGDCFHNLRAAFLRKDKRKATSLMTSNLGTMVRSMKERETDKEEKDS